MRIASALALGLVVLGCAGHSQTLDSGGDAGVAAVHGSIAGISFPSASYAIAIPNNENATANPGNQYTQLALAVAGKPLVCTTSSLPDSVFIGLQIIVPGSLPIGPGTYAIDANPDSSNDNVAALVTTDGSCVETSPANCIGGSVTLTEVTAASVTGSFTLAFDSGEAMTGSFAAEVCKAIPSSVNGSGC